MSCTAALLTLVVLNACQVIGDLTDRSTNANKACLHNSDCASNNVCLFQTCSVACLTRVSPLCGDVPGRSLGVS